MQEDLIDKLATAYQPLSKTISDLGSIVKGNNNEIIDLKRLVKDHIDVVNKKLDSHDTSIEDLTEAKTTIFSSIATTKWVASVLFTVIVAMGGFIITSWAEGYDQRLSKIESERKETLDKVFQLLNDKKNYLNQETIKSIFANL